MIGEAIVISTGLVIIILLVILIWALFFRGRV